MADIKFIKKITDYIDIPRKIVGNCVYYTLQNGNRIKLYCYELGVQAEVINKIEGKIDGIKLSFANYFKPTKCSSSAPRWTQRIENDRWYFEDMYKHVLPTDEDYQNLADAIVEYMEMFE